MIEQELEAQRAQAVAEGRAPAPPEVSLEEIDALFAAAPDGPSAPLHFGPDLTDIVREARENA